ncbi:roadblock/LC7 domain-containing protein [Longimicrobium sp.]|uniref:roadblock/LC7 domain-containing protein n=1 Tax=Longimicrobium sp. TaxID=2029185 RepID=UPI002C030BF8|nr:roadblock/LC7 domain-containing protein [Longimicrobium sp.]HSU17919.1 roadblock/LC7 domain-containing protein [Longimicrobium sp.]
MRRADLAQFVGALAPPVERFAREGGLRLVLLINESGQVLAQRGFARALDVMGVAALGAGIHASSHALAVMLGEGGFRHLHQGGAVSQVFIGPFRTPAEDLIAIAVFGEDSSIGLVQVFFDEFVREVAALPGWSETRPTADAASFERDLTAGLETIFGGQDGAAAGPGA